MEHKFLEFLYENFVNVTPIEWLKYVVMWIIGIVLIFLAIKKEMEPTLLLPLGFGTIMVNLPFSGAITQGLTEGPLSVLFDAGIANELFPPDPFHRYRRHDRLRSDPL